jgi:hypothetical protein
MAIRVTQTFGAGLVSATPNARTTQAYAQTVVTVTTARARVTQAYVNVLAPVSTPATPITDGPRQRFTHVSREVAAVYDEVRRKALFTHVSREVAYVAGSVTPRARITHVSREVAVLVGVVPGGTTRLRSRAFIIG